MEELKDIIKELLKILNKKRCVIIKFGNKTIEFGENTICKKLDFYNLYKKMYYIYYDKKYQTISNTLDKEFINILYSTIEWESKKEHLKDIQIHIKENNRKEIQRINELSLDVIGKLLRKTMFLSDTHIKTINKKELEDLFINVDYITYSFPFQFKIGKDKYRMGIGCVDKELDKNGIYDEHQFLEKNGEVVFVKDPDEISYDDIVNLINNIISQPTDKIKLIIEDDFMSGRHDYLFKLNDEVISQIEKANNIY